MADLAALGCAHAAGLAGAEGREVVVVDVALAVNGLDGVKALPLIEHTQRGYGEHLGLTALEETGAMDAWQVVGLDHERTYLGGAAAVDTLAALHDHSAHGMLLEALELDGDRAIPLELLVLAELRADGLLERLTLPMRASLSASVRAARISSK